MTHAHALAPASEMLDVTSSQDTELHSVNEAVHQCTMLEVFSISCVTISCASSKFSTQPLLYYDAPQTFAAPHSYPFAWAFTRSCRMSGESLWRIPVKKSLRRILSIAQEVVPFEAGEGLQHRTFSVRHVSPSGALDEAPLDLELLSMALPIPTSACPR